jgi:hypothetical protein
VRHEWLPLQQALFVFALERSIYYIYIHGSGQWLYFESVLWLNLLQYALFVDKWHFFIFGYLFSLPGGWIMELVGTCECLVLCRTIRMKSSQESLHGTGRTGFQQYSASSNRTE